MTEDTPSMEKTLYRMNGTLMKDGDLGSTLVSIDKNLALIADRLEKMNWNLGTIAKNTSK